MELLEEQGICGYSDTDAMSETSTISSDGLANSFNEEQNETTEGSQPASLTSEDSIDETDLRNKVTDWLINVAEPTSQNDEVRDMTRPPLLPNEDSPARLPQEMESRLRQRFKRRKWMDSELIALEKGMKKYTDDKLIWVHILKDETYGPTLKNRSPTDLKDKARNEKKKRAREGRLIGVFHLA
ncbi:39368_t:CDS:2, partial [Gigaspora margarita]